MAHTHEHVETHFDSSIRLRDIVIGMSDGLTVPFALAAGLSAAVNNNSLILTAGLAEIVAGAISMGLGGYLAGKTYSEHYHGELAREYQEVESIPEEEKNEVRVALERYGLSSKTKDIIVEELARDKDKWVDFMMRFELGLEEPMHGQAFKSAISVGGAYVIAGLVPLFPYVITQSTKLGLFYSSLTTLVALALFGYGKSKVTGQPPLAGALRTLGTGAFAAALAYFVARLMKVA